MQAELLDCGHEQAAGHVARTRDDRTLCDTCSYEREKADLRTARRFVAYLSREQQGRAWYVTTWLGGRLMEVVSISKSQRWTWRGYQACYFFRARDVHGQDWVGQGEGECMYCTLRRAAKSA